MTRTIPLIAALAFLAGCQSPPEPVPEAPVADPLAATLSGEACPDVGQRAYFFWMEPRSAEPGDNISLFPYWTDMPGAYNDLPAGCLGDLGVYPEGAATFTRQDSGVPVATIAPDVAPGTRVLLQAKYRGQYGLSGPVEVYRTADNPLVGTWRQAEDGCPPDSAVRELVFTAGGEFSVTWTPFETYKDYWGTYVYDAATSAVRLDIQNGNQVPEDVVPEGVVSVGDGTLSFDTLSFGTPGQAQKDCRARFRK